MNPYDNAHELAKNISNSDVAERLRTAKERIEQEPSTLALLKDYRRREWELQTKIIDGQELTAEEEQSLQKLSEVIQLNSDVLNYLEAERQLTVMLMDIQDILSKTIEDLLFEHPEQSE